MLPVIAEPALQPTNPLIAQMSNKLTQEGINQTLAAIKTALEQEDIEGILKYHESIIVVLNGVNGAKYDNPHNSADYDQGYREGISQRRGR